MRTSALKKAALFLQITAIVLVQFYAVTPLLSSNFGVQAGTMRCTGDHAMCGCSSARIASRTCCCYQSKHLVKISSSVTEAADRETSVTHTDHEDHAGSPGTSDLQIVAKTDCSHKDAVRSAADVALRDDLFNNPESARTEPRVQDHQGRTGATICAVPCGSDPAVITTSLDNAKFLCASVLLTEPAAFTTEYQHPRSTLFQSRFLEPPDPPPRLSLFS